MNCGTVARHQMHQLVEAIVDFGKRAKYKPGCLSGFTTGGRRPEGVGRRLICPATMVGGPAGGENFSAKALSNHTNLAKSAPKSALSAQPNLNWVFLLGPAFYFFTMPAFLSLFRPQHDDVLTWMSSIMGAELAHMRVEASMMLAADQSNF